MLSSASAGGTAKLLGQEHGAFTGAVTGTARLPTRLDGGTLFMDEIGELAADAQALLLRFLREREGRPVGAARNVTVDVRIITATHRDPGEAAERGGFREDFYYRLCWAVVDVPPLRERREDIALVVDHFRDQATRHGLVIKRVTRAALDILEADDWPGNVRKLERVVTRAMIRRRGGWVTAEDVILPKLRRERLPEAVLAIEASLTPAPPQALRLAANRGEVRRADLMARCGISWEVARRELAGLVRVGPVRREARGRGA